MARKGWFVWATTTIVCVVSGVAWIAAAPRTQAQAPTPTPAAPGQRVMTDLSPDRVKALMQAFNQALGVECVHCHVAEQWADESKPALGTARNMYRMVQVVNQRLEGVGEVSCWTCHGGQQQPARQPRPPFDAEMAAWPADLAAAPDGQKAAMAVYDVALGVSCDHCHTAGDWKKRDKRAIKLVATMTGLFDEFPKYMPASARTQCFMCHKGATKPVAHAPAIVPGLL